MCPHWSRYPCSVRPDVSGFELVPRLQACDDALSRRERPRVSPVLLRSCGEKLLSVRLHELLASVSARDRIRARAFRVLRQQLGDDLRRHARRTAVRSDRRRPARYAGMGRSPRGVSAGLARDEQLHVSVRQSEHHAMELPRRRRLLGARGPIWMDSATSVSNPRSHARALQWRAGRRGTDPRVPRRWG